MKSDIELMFCNPKVFDFRYGSIKQNFELREHELEVLKQRLQQASHYQQKEEVDGLRQNIGK